MLARAPAILLVALLGLAATLVAASAARARDAQAEAVREEIQRAPVTEAPSAPAAVRPPGALRSTPGSARAERDPRYELIRVRRGRAVSLRSGPGGPRIGRLSARTRFGSPRVLLSPRRSGRWVGIVSEERPNGTLGWIDGRSSAVNASGTDVSLHVDLSRRRLELRARGKVRATMAVAVGRPGSTTPTGRFSVTDKLSGRRFGPYYGCCVLALSGTQPNTPPGWRGGDRLAIHGTDAPGSLGKASSAGCLRAAERDLRGLMRRVPLGTPVIVRR